MNHYTPDGRDLRVELQPYLHPDETLLWTGQPYTTRPYRVNPFVCIFMLFWFGFAVFWTVTATAAGGFFGLFGIPFMLFGAVMLYQLFVGQKKRLRATVYAVTDRRAIILTTDRNGTDCTEYILSRFTSISMEDVEGTTGSIRFAPDRPYDNEYGYGHRRRGFQVSSDSELKTAFLAIDGVQEVYRLLSEQMQAD